MGYEHMDQLRSRLGTYDAGMILDVAIGRGGFLKFVLGAFGTWNGAAGIDINPDSLETAKSVLGSLPVTLVKGSALSMPFPDHVFDTVTLSHSLHHMEDTEGLVAEIARVCKAGGLILINEMINDQATTMQENHMLYHHLISEIDNQLGHYHRDLYSTKELKNLINESGFQIVEQFLHEETKGSGTRKEDIDELVRSLNRRIEMLHNTEYYYFYENKIHEVIDRLQKDGFHKPKEMAVFLRKGK
ncbi:MAG: methyltransferase domain-containing protein [Bacteroidales bacterium]|nr:methyltransferase domain-containing protein [Bacteroidales bacterium]